jgi:hypothetical protein
MKQSELDKLIAKKRDLIVIDSRCEEKRSKEMHKLRCRTKTGWLKHGRALKDDAEPIATSMWYDNWCMLYHIRDTIIVDESKASSEGDYEIRDAMFEDMVLDYNEW